MKKLNIVIRTALLVGATLAATMASASDKELLKTLYNNGVLNKAQYQKLLKQEKSKESFVSSAKSSKSSDWFSKIKIGGDMRFRHENIDRDDTNGVKESRQRIRARLKVSAEVNDEVDVGLRLVTTGGQTSTNQTIEGSFSGKDIFLDRAYINWHPDFLKGASAIFGKFGQPWYNVSSAGLVWDSDVNPEGVAVTYKTKLGDVQLAATGGYFILEDGDTMQGTANNNGFSDDLNMYHAGLSASMKFNDKLKGSVGSNVFIYNKEMQLQNGVVGTNLENSAMEIYEVAGRIDVDTGILPVYTYAQYAVNEAAIDSDQNTAWLAGFGAKYGSFKLNYNYRDTQRFAVADTFNDSDFAIGNVAARGHKVKASYKISKNFSLGSAYLAAREYSGRNTDIFQLDLKAKF
ncbi:MAG: putative porin [Methylococcales bacterium]|nr:putative porin [Methylococcales bacterium]